MRAAPTAAAGAGAAAAAASQPSMGSPSSTQRAPQQQAVRPPEPSSGTQDAPKASSGEGKADASKSAPAKSGFLSKAFNRSSNTPASPRTESKAASTKATPPAPVVADLPEPIAPPDADQVDLATPSRREQIEAQRKRQQQAQANLAASAPAQAEMKQQPAAPVTMAAAAPGRRSGDDRAATMSSEGEDDGDDSAALASAKSRPSQQSSRSGRGAGAGTAAAAAGGAAGLGAAGYAAANSGGFGAGRRGSEEAPAHTAFNMGSDDEDDDAQSPFNERSDAGSQGNGTAAAAAVTPASAIAAAAAGQRGNHNSSTSDLFDRGSQAPNNKYANEGSNGRWGAPAAGAAGGLYAQRRSGGLGNNFRNNKKKWLIGGAILIAILIAAIVGGVVGSSGSSSNSSGSADGSDASDRSSGTSDGGSSGSPDSAEPGGTGIEQDSRLHKVFWGMNYEPFGTDAGAGCTANITGVMEDVKVLSQLTTRVRLGGSACNETALVLDAIARTEVDMTVYPAIVLDLDTTATSASWTNQVNNLTYAFDTFGTRRIGAVQVGNEYISTTGGTQAALVDLVTQFKSLVSDNSDWGDLPVTTSEQTSTWTPTMADAVDVIFATNQPFYSEEDIDTAASWAFGYVQDTLTPLSQDATGTPEVVISEIGWPTNAASTAAATSGDAVAGQANSQQFLDDWVCPSRANGTAYFYYELYDFVSSSRTDGVAPYWGLFDANKELKMQIPSC